MGVRAAAAILVLTCAAQAAVAGDIEVLPPRPDYYDWSGVYIGANVGYGSGSISETVTGAGTSSTQSFSGAIAGGQVGVNFFYRGFLFGVEADADWSNQQSSGTSLGVNLSRLATARVRVGGAYDRIVIYATGGVGSVQLSSTAPSGTAVSSSRTAWVAGIGQESAVTPNVVLRFEALYLQLLGSTETPSGVTPVVSSQRVYDVIGRAGLSYKFGWPGY